MNEKIILTVEQNEALKGMPGRHWSNEAIIKNHAKGKWVDERNKPLNDLSLDQIARVLYEPNSYEVEQPKIQPGDWVTRITGNLDRQNQFANNRTFKVNKVRSDQTVTDSDECYHSVKSLRPATKEEIFWAELGREVGEFKDDDMLISDGGIYKVKRNPISSDSKKMYEDGKLKGFYPASSFIKFPDKS